MRASDDVLADFEAIEYALYKDALDCSTVARLGVMATLAQQWSGPGAKGDRANVESNRPAEYSALVWESVIEAAAYRLIRREGFWIAHGAVARELEREGRLTYEKVAELVAGSPGATPPSVGPPRSEVAASERRPASITHDAVKVADAASGGLGTSQPGPPVLSKVQT